MDNRIFEVSELNERIKGIIELDPVLFGLYVRGEISNYKVYPSGHAYFTLKDRESALKCVMFKTSGARMRFKPESGMKVIAFGRVSVYTRDGAYQLYVNELTPDGLGELHAAYEQLKEKLRAEGLFDPAVKKPLPRFPSRIAVVTSSAGAAVRDIIRILGKRWPLAKVVVLPVRVQGAEAPPEIVGAIEYANRHCLGDLIITGRGGGSIEDLWAFNDERVARAVFASEIPVISAVGHEPDFTITDFVADVRAATPSNAAELAVPDQYEFREYMDGLEIRAASVLKRRLEAAKTRLCDLASRRVMRDPRNYLSDRRTELETYRDRLFSAGRAAVASKKQEYIRLAAQIDAMSPLKVLGRGYSIVSKDGAGIIKSAFDTAPGDRLTIRLAKGQIGCEVLDNGV